MTLIFWLFLSTNAQGAKLELVEAVYKPPPRSASCGLLRQREKERLKVIRELSHLKRSPDYEYWLSKVFMPAEVWSDESTEVILTLKVPEEFRQRAAADMNKIFLITEAPGFIWQSYANQLPPAMQMNLSDDFLTVRYFTFLNAICESNLKPLSVEWILDPETVF